MPSIEYRRSDDVIATDLADELILLDPRNGRMFSLNATGRHVWLALPGAVESITQYVAAHFDVSAEEARLDVATVLTALCEARLVERPRGDAELDGQS